jgi:hypothetical protein
MNMNLNKATIGLLLGVAAMFTLLGPIAGAGRLEATEVIKSYDFAIDEWQDIGEVDGPVTLHRIRIDRKEDRFNKSTLARPANLAYLEPVRFQLEYTNGASQKWKARVEVRWMDEDGVVIDGFSANETLDKKSAQKIAHASFSTLKYGIKRAKTLEVKVRFEP